jgi:4-amino-4-deoxy-L-arabinose transferase-like glycosyltransferase
LVEIGIVAGLLVMAIGVPAVLATSAHAFGIPRNDDWAYRRVLLEFARTGHFAPVGWGSMTLVGQVLWAAPFVLVFGPQAWAPGLSVVVAAAVGVVCAYLLARLCLGRRPAAACAFVLLVLPGFVLNTSTFMTDVPAFAADMACMVMGIAALRSAGRAHWAWLAAALAVGALGFSIREFDLAAPVAVLIVAARQDRRHRRHYLVAGIALAVVCGATYLWTSQLPGVQHKGLGLPAMSALQAVAGAYFTLAFVISPLLPAVVRRSWRSASPLAAALATAALVVGLLLVLRREPVLIGNYLTQKGATGAEVLGGARPNLFPEPIWRLLQLVAVVAGSALAFVAAARPAGSRRASRAHQLEVVRAFTALSAAGLIGYGLLVRAPMWDRYLWPVAFGASVVLFARRAPGRVRRTTAPPALRALAIALAAPAVLAALALTLNADAYDAARWSAGQEAVAAGYAPATVDAGFEWVGSHSPSMAQPGRQVAGAPVYETWYDQMFPGLRVCAFVSGSLYGGPTFRPLGVIRYEEVAFADPQHLYVYAVRGPGCP